MTIIEHPDLQDGSTEPWPKEVVSSHVRDFVKKSGIKTVGVRSRGIKTVWVRSSGVETVVVRSDNEQWCEYARVVLEAL